MIRTRRGFTVVEISIAALIGIGVLGMATVLVRWASVSALRSAERLDPCESAHLALSTLRAALMDAWYYRVSEAGGRLEFHGPRKDGEVTFDRARRRVRFRPPGQSRAHDLVDGDVDELVLSSVRPGCISVELRLPRRERGSPLRPLPTLVLADEILVPSIAQRDVRTPWNRALEHRKALVASLGEETR